MERPRERPRPRRHYRVGTNQIVNPEYVQIQAQLQAAQVQLAQVQLKWALNPPTNGWSGFAKGVEEGGAQGAVNSLTRRLIETPAFLEESIEAPYALTQTEITKVGAVAIDVEITTEKTTRVFATQIHAASEAISREISGAMTTDLRGNRNARADFLPDGRFYAQALSNFEDRDAVRRILRETLIGIADSTPPGSEALHTLGTLLLADDLKVPNESLPAEYVEALRPLERVDLSDLRSMKVNIRATSRCSGGR